MNENEILQNYPIIYADNRLNSISIPQNRKLIRFPVPSRYGNEGEINLWTEFRWETMWISRLYSKVICLNHLGKSKLIQEEIIQYISFRTVSYDWMEQKEAIIY